MTRVQEATSEATGAASAFPLGPESSEKGPGDMPELTDLFRTPEPRGESNPFHTDEGSFVTLQPPSTAKVGGLKSIKFSYVHNRQRKYNCAITRTNL